MKKKPRAEKYIYPLRCIRNGKKSTRTLAPLVMRFIRIRRVLAIQLYARVRASTQTGQPTKAQFAFTSILQLRVDVCACAVCTTDIQHKICTTQFDSGINGYRVRARS